MEADKRILDYKRPSQTRQKPLARVVHLFVKTVFWILGSLVLCVVLIILAIKIRASIFDEKMSEAKFIGKTPQAIIAQFGTPFDDGRTDGLFGANGNFVITYGDRWSHEMCNIEFNKGIATKVRYFNSGN
jgi:hypothetical protein